MPTTTALTHKERMSRALERRDHDRVPRFESFWGDTIRRWEGEGLHGGEEAVYDLLEVDMKGFGWVFPEPFPGRWETLSEDATTRTSRDPFGGIVRYFKDKNTTPEHIGWDCDSPEKWRQVYRPALERYSPPMDECRAGLNHAREKQRFACINSVEQFEFLRKLLGDVVAMESIIEEPEWIAEISEVFADAYLGYFDKLWAAGIRPDAIFTYGDMAFNHATLCSPAQYKELIWPQHKRMCDWAHAHGLKFIYHTDGDVNGVLDLYVEAGFDSLQPLECKANMDIRKLAPAYGSKLSLFGNIDVMKMIPNDLGIIEEEISSKFAAGKATNGYIYHSDHSVPPQVSWQTYQGIIELVKKHGEY